MGTLLDQPEQNVLDFRWTPYALLPMLERHGVAILLAMNVLFILNETPAESHRALNALRLACAMSLRPSLYVRIFLIGSAVACALSTPQPGTGQDDAKALLQAVIQHGGAVRVSDICAEEHHARAGAPLLAGVVLSSLAELARWVPEAERLLVF